MLEMAYEEEMIVLRSPINSLQQAPGWSQCHSAELAKTSVADSLLTVGCQ